MKRNKVYIVTPVQIENWDEGGALHSVVFARSKTQAAAAYAAKSDLPLGLDEANPNDPYVYEVKIPAVQLRTHMGDYDYRNIVLEPGTKVLGYLSPHERALSESIMRVFMGE